MHAVTEDELEPGYDWQRLNNELDPEFSHSTGSGFASLARCPTANGVFLSGDCKDNHTSQLGRSIRRLNTRFRLLTPGLRRKIVMYAPLLALVFFIAMTGYMFAGAHRSAVDLHAARDGIMLRDVTTTASERQCMLSSGDVRDLHEIHDALQLTLTETGFSCVHAKEIGSCINAVVFRSASTSDTRRLFRHTTSPCADRPDRRVVVDHRSVSCDASVTERHDFSSCVDVAYSDPNHEPQQIRCTGADAYCLQHMEKVAMGNTTDPVECSRL